MSLQGTNECQESLKFKARLIFYNKLVSELEPDAVFGGQSSTKASSLEITGVQSLINLRTDKVTYSFPADQYRTTRISTGVGFDADLESSVPVSLEYFGFGKSLSRLALTNSNGRVVGLALVKSADDIIT